MGRPGGQVSNLREGALSRADRVIVHAEDEGSDGVDVALGEALEHGGILLWFVEALVHIFQVGGIDRFHADEDPFATGGGDEVNEFLITQQVGADLGDPVELRSSGNDIPQ